MTAGRADGRAAFLARAGWGAAECRALAGDASNRRYFRLARGGSRAVLMDAPPQTGETIGPFLDITHRLRAAGLSAPQPLADDPGEGFLLLEDLGDDLYARLATRSPDREAGAYAAAVDLLAEALPAVAADGLAPYDWAVLRREALAAPEWYLTGATGMAPSADLHAEFEGLLAEALGAARHATNALVLRDYHAENLLWLEQRVGHARVGLLDYQDALAGHPAYDLVSLLEDARRDTSAELRETMISRYLDRAPQHDREAFAAAYAALGAQRNLKIVGYFARLSMRDGKDRYLELIPRVWAHLMRDLAAPGLAALQRFVEARLPPPEPELLSRIAAHPPMSTAGR